jgi:hypothetical protein
MSERTPYVLDLKAEELEEQIWRMQRQACAYRAEANALRALAEDEYQERLDQREFERVSGLRVAS